MVKNIFETNSRKEIIKNFLNKYSCGYTEFLSSLSGDYTNGINALREAVKTPQINKKYIEIACSHFSTAGKEDKGKNRLLAYLGQIVCLHVMDNLFAITTLTRVILTLEPRIPINLPVKLNLKGVSQNIIKGAGIAAGGAISFIPPFRIAGVAITQAALRYQTEDAVLSDRPFDPEFYQLRNEIVGIEYEKLHKLLR